VESEPSDLAAGLDVIPTPHEPAPTGPTDLRATAAKGTLINGAFMVGLNGLQLVKNFLAAGLIATSAFGIWGALTLGIGVLAMLKDGLGNKYVQQEEEDQEEAFQKAFTLELIANAALMVVMLIALPLLALVTSSHELLLPGLVFIATVPAYALKTPLWIYYRDMRFARQRLFESLDPVVSLVVTVGLAVAGYGYWALVFGYFAGVWSGALFIAAATPVKLRIRFDRETAGQYLSFTWPILVANAAGMLIPSLLIIVGEPTLGLAGVGMMTLAGSIASYTDRVDQIITETMYPAICRARDRTDVLFEAFVKSNRLDLAWGIPFGVGIALFATDLVHFGIGDKWAPGTILIQAFALTAAANHLGYNWTAFLRARGETRPLAIAGPIVLSTFLLVTIPLLIFFEMPGLAVGMGIMTAVSLCVRTYFIRRLFPRYSMVRQAIRALTPTLPAVALVAVMRLGESGSRSLGLALAELAVYLAATTLLTLLLERSLLAEILIYLRRDSGAVADASAPA
jgi:O-antigen/teichoic acid export membrane protein